MSYPYNTQRVRIQQDVAQWFTQGTEVLTGVAPQFANGCSVRFEFAFSFGELASDDEFIDMTQYASVTMDVKRATERTGLPLMSKTVVASGFSVGLTKADWDAGEDQHVAFEFTSAEADVFITADSEALWMVVSAQTVDAPAKSVPLAAWQITVVEDGAGVATPTSVAAPLYYTAAQSDSRYLMAADLSSKLSRDGSLAMTGNLTLAGSTPSNSLHAASKGYVDATVTAYLPLSGGALSGALTLSGAPSSNLHAATKLYVDTADGLALLKAGGTMTGPLVLSGAPTVALHAATKAYADLMLPLVGGTLTGALTLASSSPSNSLHAASKGYVDATVAAIVASAPSDMDTLEAISSSLGDDTDFAGTMTDALALKLSVSGGTMSGALTLAGAPTDPLHAATKAYADAAQAAAQAASVPIVGGTVTGQLAFSGTTHLGLRVLNIASAYANSVTATNGSIYYDATANRLMAVEGGARKWLFENASGGTTWHNQAGAFSGSSPGASGDYGLETTTGGIYLNSGGTWALLLAARLPLSGGTLTGALTLAGPPTDPLHAATKAYVDSVVTGGGSFLPVDGSAMMTGNLVFDDGLSPAIDFGSSSWVVQTASAGAELQFNCGFEGMVLVKDGSDCVITARNGYFNAVTGGYKVAGITVVSGQQSAITHVAETGSDTDGAARVAINQILGALEAHGLLATP